MADNDREALAKLRADQAVTSVHPEELNADLRVKGSALCECGARFTGAHNHPACLYCQVVPGAWHDWTKPHPRMVWRLDSDHE